MTNERKSDLPDYDAIVENYEQFAEPMTAAFGAAALALAAVQRGERALDVAAGTGALTLPLIDIGAEVTAIDISAPMVARLTTRMAERRCGGQAQVMNGQALGFANDCFDVALSLFGVMLFADFRAGLREMARVVRPGGRCVVGVWADSTAPMRLLHDALALALPGREPGKPPAGMTALGTTEGMTAELEAVGLMSPQIELVTLPWTHPPRHDFAGKAERFFASIPPWPELTPHERESLRTAMATLAERDAAVPFTSTALLGLARKPTDEAAPHTPAVRLRW